MHWSRSIFRSKIRRCLSSQSELSTALPDTSPTNGSLAAEPDQKFKEAADKMRFNLTLLSIIRSSTSTLSYSKKGTQ